SRWERKSARASPRRCTPGSRADGGGGWPRRTSACRGRRALRPSPTARPPSPESGTPRRPRPRSSRSHALALKVQEEPRSTSTCEFAAALREPAERLGRFEAWSVLDRKLFEPRDDVGHSERVGVA